MRKPIVVTGIGVVSSVGIGKDLFWENLLKGKSGISQIETFDTSQYPTHLGGEVKNFRPQDFIPKKRIKHISRTSALAISAARLALEDAKLNLKGPEKEKTGVIMGTTMGETQAFEQLNAAWVEKGVEGIDCRLVSRIPGNTLAASIGIEFGFKGPNLALPNACAAGNYAIGYACDLIEDGVSEVMLAGGADAFSRIAFTGFNRLLAVAPEKCQPFDKNRKGMMVGEGAAVVVLETLDSALKRKANIYARILGYGLSCDAHHMTAPLAAGISKAIEKALLACGLRPGEVDYISAHGTGTPANDREECIAIKAVFKEEAGNILISSIKSMLGHTMGAASAIEAVACILAAKHDIVPPTINYQTPDPECGLDCVPNTCRRTKVDIALNSASAFGGNNACLVVKKFTP